MPTGEEGEAEDREHDGNRPGAATEQQREEASERGAEDAGISQGQGHHHHECHREGGDAEGIGRPMGEVRIGSPMRGERPGSGRSHPRSCLLPVRGHVGFEYSTLTG